MTSRAARSTAIGVSAAAFAVLCWTIFRGYLTPEMLVYFLTFQWCF